MNFRQYRLNALSRVKRNSRYCLNYESQPFRLKECGDIFWDGWRTEAERLRHTNRFTEYEFEKLSQALYLKYRGIPQDCIRLAVRYRVDVRKTAWALMYELPVVIDTFLESAECYNDVVHAYEDYLAMISLYSRLIEYQTKTPILRFLDDFGARKSWTITAAIRVADDILMAVDYNIKALALVPRLTSYHIAFLDGADREQLIRLVLEQRPCLGRRPAITRGSVAALAALRSCGGAEELIAEYCFQHKDLIPEVSAELGIPIQQLGGDVTMLALQQ